MTNEFSPILLIEDRAIDLDLTKRALARSKIVNPILVARNGEEALTFLPRWEAGERPPIFVLLDLKLPKVNGLEFLRQVRRHPQFHSIPIIILTTSAEDCDIKEAYKLGCNSYIVKPLDFTRFVEVASQIESYWGTLNTAP